MTPRPSRDGTRLFASGADGIYLFAVLDHSVSESLDSIPNAGVSEWSRDGQRLASSSKRVVSGVDSLGAKTSESICPAGRRSSLAQRRSSAELATRMAEVAPSSTRSQSSGRWCTSFRTCCKTRPGAR